VNPEGETSRTVLVVSEKGFGKRTAIDEYRFTNRGGKGVKTINVTEKTGKLVGILDVAEKEDLMITCKSGVIIRMKVSDISEQGRATQGVKLIRLDEGDEIAGITRLEVEAMNGNGNGNAHDQAQGNDEIRPSESTDHYGDQATNPSKDSSEESTEV
jgi:DNA gyrase subunit A